MNNEDPSEYEWMGPVMGKPFIALVEIIRILAQAKFTGSLEIHFNQGSAGKIIKHEKIK